MNTDLIVFFGPPAVGKAAIANEFCKLTGYRLFHNHMTADPVLAVLGFENGDYREIADEFRLRIFSAAIEANISGIAFTIGWDLDSKKDLEFLKSSKEMFVSSGGKVGFVELMASPKTREDRVSTPFRLEHKPRPADIEEAKVFVREASEKWRMNSTGEIPFSEPHVILDTEKSNEAALAVTIVEELAIETVDPA